MSYLSECEIGLICEMGIKDFKSWRMNSANTPRLICALIATDAPTIMSPGIRAFRTAVAGWGLKAGVIPVNEVRTL